MWISFLWFIYKCSSYTTFLQEIGNIYSANQYKKSRSSFWGYLLTLYFNSWSSYPSIIMSYSTFSIYLYLSPLVQRLARDLKFDAIKCHIKNTDIFSKDNGCPYTSYNRLSSKSIMINFSHFFTVIYEYRSLRHRFELSQYRFSRLIYHKDFSHSISHCS